MPGEQRRCPQCWQPRDPGEFLSAAHQHHLPQVSAVREPEAGVRGGVPGSRSALVPGGAAAARQDGRMNDSGQDPCSLGSGKVKRSTPKALLVELDSGEEQWVPRSVIHEDSELYTSQGENAEGELVVLQWWAEKEGFG